MGVQASDVAKHIVNFCINEGTPISNLQLQKMLYFCQVKCYQDFSRPLFEDDFEAWRYGPVIPSVYRLFSIYGGNEITRRVEGGKPLSPSEENLVERVVTRLLPLRPWELVKMTHSQGSPWDQTYKGGSGSGCVIEKTFIATSVQ